MFLFRLFGKFIGGIFRTLVFSAILLAGLALGGYAWFANSQLQKAVSSAGIKDGYQTSYRVVSRNNAPIETTWPFTFRVYIKQTEAHNWIPTEKHGLVSAILQWSPDQNRWVEEPADSLPATQRVQLETMIRARTNGSLIESLKDDDPIVREVAFRELKIRTEQDFAYRPDASEAERAIAVARWEEWWDDNKVRWTSRRILERAAEILE